MLGLLVCLLALCTEIGMRPGAGLLHHLQGHLIVFLSVLLCVTIGQSCNESWVFVLIGAVPDDTGLLRIKQLPLQDAGPVTDPHSLHSIICFVLLMDLSTVWTRTTDVVIILTKK